MASKDSLTSVTVLDQASIERQQPQELTELLAAQPGIDMVTNGGYGKSTSIYTRGSAATGTKLLIDGVPIQSLSTGQASWQYLPMAQIKRVEIVRGPKSSLYGSSAAGGVVQVFLPDGEQGQAADISVGGGSHNTKHADVSVSGGDEDTRYALSLGTFQTDGTQVKEGRPDMGYDNDHLLARVQQDFAHGIYGKALIMRAQGESDYESGDDLQHHDYVNQVLALTGGVDVNEYWQTELQVREARDEDDVLDAQGEPTGSYFDSRSRAVRWNNTLWYDNHEFVVGSEYSEDNFEGSYDNERDNRSVFAQSISEFGDISVQLNIRADHYDEYDTQTTGGVALGYQIDPQHSVRLSSRSSFTAPTFNSMTAVNWGYTPVNDIRPETSDSIEVGMRGDYQISYWDAALYQADYDDMIAWNYSNRTIGNIDKARVQGLELETGLSLEQWRVALAATVMDTENRSANDNRGNRLARRAHKSARIDVDRLFAQGSVGATLVGYGERYNDPENTEMLPGYGVLNLRASYDVTPALTTKLSLKNALDKDYENAKGYRNAGRGIFLSLNYAAF
nr:TonB-dependent receptor [Marinomonas ostreistagni]